MTRKFVNVRLSVRRVWIVGPVLVATSALGQQKDTDGSRVDRKAPMRSEAASLVTGSPKHLRSVVAGTPPTARLMVNPVAAKVGAYPPGTMIVGNGLRAPEGNFRAWFEFQIADWDPNGDGDPALKAWAATIDASGYLDSDAPGDQPDITPAVAPCADDAACLAAFGESWAKCETVPGFCSAGFCVSGNLLGNTCVVSADCTGTFCQHAYVDQAGTGRPDSWCADTGQGSCNTSVCSTARPNTYCSAVYAATRPDDGTVKYGATLVLDIPPGAKGKYTVNLLTDETFLANTGAPPEDIPTLSETGFVVNIVPGLCCFGLGTVSAGCADGLREAECAGDDLAYPPPKHYVALKTCADACAECGLSSGCDDGDACTQDLCRSGGQCSHAPKVGWNPTNACCNAADGSVDLLINANPCYVPSCTLPNHRGDLYLIPLSEGMPCAFDDVCFSEGACNAAGHCVGTLSTGDNCGKNRALTFWFEDTGEMSALRVTMIELQNPVPANAPQFPPPDFTAYESGPTCTDPGGCARWVGPLYTYPECEFGFPEAGAFRAARLQCTPYYHDWGSEGLFHVTGGEIVPSSQYEVEVVPISCQGAEDTCATVPPPTRMRTSRHGDVAPAFNPPDTVTEPDALDIAAVVDKVKCLPGSYPKPMTQTEPNVPEYFRQHTGLDIVNVIDAFKGHAYPFSGPCPCPSTVPCAGTPCTSSTQCAGGVCYKVCVDGSSAGAPCQTGEHCPGGSCGSGLCRDACGRCNP
jgi:hypothetical protein